MDILIICLKKLNNIMELFAAIDFETANSDRKSACQIGYVIFNKTKILNKKSYLIKPPSFDFFFTEIHGITWDMVKKEKTFDKIWKLVWEDLKDIDLFFAHNAPFDKSVLHACCNHYRLPIPHQNFADTVQISRKFWDFENNKLNTVCKNLRIPLKHHDALSDSRGCAQIAIEAFKLGYVI
jgi:DNA polymerase-3 subunit epsilon|tara:strand:+ start:16331 stop:16873 length:543 start_codon:yes stop_codon:yes gene_type:complete